jgi:transitional endoplasmic reticulum ATPase
MPRAKKEGGLAVKDGDPADMLLDMVLDKAQERANGGAGGHFSHVRFQRTPEAATVLLPVDMTLQNVIYWAQKQLEQDSMPVDILMDFDAYPVDGAVALEAVLRREYKFVQFEPEIVKTMFGTEVIAPKVLQVKINADGETRQAHWGLVSVPGVAGYLKTDAKWNGRRLQFQISGKIRHGDREKIDGLEAMIRAELRENSIFRGKAIRVSFRDDEREDDPTNGKYKFDPMRAPEFMETNDRAINQLVFDAKIQKIVDDNVYGPIKFSEAFRANRLALKKGVLAAGPFGTGKTMLANAVAYLCEQNGWTYINVKDVRDLDCAFELARQYQPAVVFGEDIDRAVSGEDRTAEIDRILNTIDGVDSKNVEIITVLTTNNVDVINQAMMRPGRIDVLINVDPPSKEAALHLCRQYAGPAMETGRDAEFQAAILSLTRVQANAAVYKECTQRAIGSNVVRQCMELEAQGLIPGPVLATEIAPVDLQSAAETMTQHLEKLRPKVKKNTTPLVEFGVALGATMAKAIVDSKTEFRDALTDELVEHASSELNGSAK